MIQTFFSVFWLMVTSIFCHVRTAESDETRLLTDMTFKQNLAMNKKQLVEGDDQFKTKDALQQQIFDNMSLPVLG